MGTIQYDRRVRVVIAILVVLCLTQCFLLFIQHIQVNRLTGVTCSATAERLGRIDLYRSIIDSERDNKFIDDELRAKRIKAYETQIGLVQATVTAADFACEPQAGRYLIPSLSPNA